MPEGLPTVRVANPAAPHTFMTINAADLAAHHEVWGEQADDYEPVAPIEAKAEIDPAERDLSARLMAALMAQKLGMPLAEWQGLPTVDRFGLLQDAEREIAAHLIERQNGPTGAVEQEMLRVVKGARGLWFVRRGTEKVAGGFVTEGEATAEADRISAQARLA